MICLLACLSYSTASSSKAGTAFDSYLHLKPLERCLHVVETRGLSVKWIIICLAVSAFLQVVDVRVGLKEDLGYQIIALKSSLLAIS